MQRLISRSLAAGGLVVALGAGTACAQLGALGDVLGAILVQPGQQAGEAVVQLRGVDTQRQIMDVQTEQGQRGGIGYDQRTRFFDEEGNEGRVTNLRQGDILAMRVHQAEGGYYAEVVQRRNDLAQRTDDARQMQQVAGHVRSVNRQNRSFQLETLYGPTVTVELAAQVSREDLERFERLQAGAYITAAGEVVGETTFRLHRFV